VLRSALQMADKGGIDSRAMRKLAKALNVEAVSLYNHGANTEDLRAAIQRAIARSEHGGCMRM
jgi:hypothetical protein